MRMLLLRRRRRRGVVEVMVRVFARGVGSLLLVGLEVVVLLLLYIEYFLNSYPAFLWR